MLHKTVISARLLQHRLGVGLDRRRHVAAHCQSALAGERRRRLRRHPFLYAMVRTAGCNPVSVLLGGLIMLAIALALWPFNRRAGAGGRVRQARP